MQEKFKLCSSREYATLYPSLLFTMTASITPEQAEILRLRDLLPASLRPLITIQAASAQEHLISLRRTGLWQSQGLILLQFRPWLSLPQTQRDLLFLREVGWFDCRNWLQPGLYQGLALMGGISFLGELLAQNPVSVVLAGGVTGLALRQIWQDQQGEAAHFNADDFALKRAQFRGYERREAARHLLAGMESAQRIDRTDALTVMRLQRLQAIAQQKG